MKQHGISTLVVRGQTGGQMSVFSGLSVVANVDYDVLLIYRANKGFLNLCLT